MTSPLIETDRIRIVRLDFDAVVAALEDRALFERILSSAVDPEWPLPDMRDLLGFVRTQLGGKAGTAHWGGVIVKKDPDVVIGDVGFHSSPVDGQVEIGYSVVPRFRSQGYATEAVGAFLRWGFQHPDIKDVIGRVSLDNPSSVKVLEKAGFEYESSTEDFIRYRISRSLLR